MMSLIGQRPEEGSTSDHGSQLDKSSSDELAAFFNLPKGTGEVMQIRTLQRFIGPIFVPILRPLIRQLVEDQIGLAKQELLANIKENFPNKTRVTTSVLRKLKLKFSNKIGQPVFTGIPILGDNQTPIEITLVDAVTDQIVKTGTESTAKLEIMGFRVSDDDDDDDNGSWTFEELKERIMSERKKRRVLLGNTRLQLKEGVCFVHEIHFTHDSKHTKNGFYRLVAIVADSNLMKQVELASTESFVVKDKRYTYHEKHVYPFLSDEVYRLQHIGHKGPRFENLQIAGVKSVKDLLLLFYKDPKRLEDILVLKASSKIFGDIVKNAQASNGMFLYFDSRNERKTGVVLDVKRQLKAFVVESHFYIPVNHLSDQQKLEVQDLVNFASENLEMLGDFEDESSVKQYLESRNSLPSAMITDEPSRTKTSAQESEACLNNSDHEPFVNEKVQFDDEIIYPTNYNQEPLNLEEWEFDDIVNYVSALLNESPNECHVTDSVCMIARTRWTKASKLLRRNSVRERISLSQGIQPPKKQKCC